MKRLLIIAMLSLAFLASEAQRTVTAERVVTNGLYLGKHWADSLVNDTLDMANNRSILTTDAVRRFVEGRKGENSSIQTLTDGPTVTLDFKNGNEGRVTISGNRTLAISNIPNDGKAHYGAIWITQDATGSRAVTLPANSKVINGGTGAVVLSKAGGATDALYFRYNPTTGIYYWTLGKNYN